MPPRRSRPAQRLAGNLARLTRRVLVWAGVGLGLALVWTVVRGRPGTLDLGEAPGLLTGRELAGLRDEPAQCRALLARAGVRFERLAGRRDGPNCGYPEAIRLEPSGARRIALAPAGPPLACPVAAALAMWEWDVVQPAARRYLGTSVVEIEHYGSYNCRHIAGQTAWSEHATADALDIAGFRFADGRSVSILHDWRGSGPQATFLRQARNGACPLFATVLSPDYNAAHRDHLHLDQAARGAWGGRACR